MGIVHMSGHPHGVSDSRWCAYLLTTGTSQGCPKGACSAPNVVLVGPKPTHITKVVPLGKSMPEEGGTYSHGV